MAFVHMASPSFASTYNPVFDFHDLQETITGTTNLHEKSQRIKLRNVIRKTRHAVREYQGPELESLYKDLSYLQKHLKEGKKIQEVEISRKMSRVLNRILEFNKTYPKAAGAAEQTKFDPSIKDNNEAEVKSIIEIIKVLIEDYDFQSAFQQVEKLPTLELQIKYNKIIERLCKEYKSKKSLSSERFQSAVPDRDFDPVIGEVMALIGQEAFDEAEKAVKTKLPESFHPKLLENIELGRLIGQKSLAKKEEVIEGEDREAREHRKFFEIRAKVIVLRALKGQMSPVEKLEFLHACHRSLESVQKLVNSLMQQAL